MKRPVLEVIRFDEAAIVTASGLGMGFTAANFGNDTLKDGSFYFFGGTGSVTSVTTEADHNGVLEAFNSYFGGGWSSTGEIWVNGSNGEASWSENLRGIIDKDRDEDIIPDEITNYSKYNVTYYYRDRGFHSN